MKKKSDVLDREEIEKLVDDEYSRRHFFERAGMVGVNGLLLTLPLWARGALVSRTSGSEKLAPPQTKPSPPKITFASNSTNDGIIGPYGTARVYSVNGQMMPLIVSAAGDLAVMDMSSRSPFVRIGTSKDTTAITLTSVGIQFGSASIIKWSPDAVKKLVGVIAASSEKTSAIMRLRSTLYSSYPVAVTKKKSKLHKKVRSSMQKHTSGYDQNSSLCTTTTITDTVTKTITDEVAVILTAEQQYQACYDKNVKSSACQLAGPFAGACAAAVCAAEAFADLIVGWIEVVTTTTEEVVRTVVNCVKPATWHWPSPWDILPTLPLTGNVVTGAVSQKSQALTESDIKDGQKLAKDITLPFIGPLGNCLINGKWSITQATVPIDLGGGKTVLPYGVKVCITTACAQQICSLDVATELASSFGSVLALLAVASPSFATFIAPVAAALPAVSAGITAAIVAAPEAVVAALIVILCDILIALYWGAAITVGCCLALMDPSSTSDGTICIEHPTIALAAIAVCLVNGAPLVAFPPIVTG